MSKSRCGKQYTPNDQRSIVKNPTSREYHLAAENDARQTSEKPAQPEGDAKK